VISGIVTDRYAIASLTFLLVNGTTFPIEFVIDTGFTDQLCLPPEAVNLLGLLNEQELVIQFTEGGLVTIDEL
jgi:predicted aspartyl protease